MEIVPNSSGEGSTCDEGEMSQEFPPLTGKNKQAIAMDTLRKRLHVSHLCYFVQGIANVKKYSEHN